MVKNGDRNIPPALSLSTSFPPPADAGKQTQNEHGMQRASNSTSPTSIMPFLFSVKT
jgi:hypothetical protein